MGGPFRALGVALVVLLGGFAGGACAGRTATITSGSDAGAVPDDAGGTDDTGADQPNDAAPDGGDPWPCDRGKPFGAPTAVPPAVKLWSHASLTSDQLLLFSDSYASSDLQQNAYVRGWERQDATAAFTSGAPVPASSGYDLEPAISGDGLTVVFTSNRAAGYYHLFVATRASRTLPWGTATMVPNVNGTAEDRGAFLRADGQVLYFASDRLASYNAYDLYRSSMTGGAFTAPAPVTELNTPASEGHAVVTADDLTIFWESNRTDLPSAGDVDIWMATRSSTSSPFDKMTNVAELNTSGSDHVDWITPDGCRIYFHNDGLALEYADRPSTSSGVTGRAHP